jgi:hypothetical protein
MSCDLWFEPSRPAHVRVSFINHQSKIINFAAPFAVDIRARSSRIAALLAKRQLIYAEHQVSRTPDARQ